MPSAPALELTFRGSDAAVAFACPRCGHIVSPSAFGDDAEANEIAAKIAADHCNKHCRCGVSIPNNRIICESCWSADQTERDEKKFELAEKIPESMYDGDPVYWEGQAGGSMGDGYFATIDEVVDFCEENSLMPPKHVWACNPVDLEINVEDILESAFQDHYEGARDMLREGAEDELSILLLAWCARQNIVSWRVDYRRAIVLDQREGVDAGDGEKPSDAGEEHEEGDHREGGDDVDPPSSSRPN